MIRDLNEDNETEDEKKNANGNENESANGNEIKLSEMSSIKETSNILNKQIMISKYFLKMAKVDVQCNINNIPRDKAQGSDWYNYLKDTNYCLDEFYRGFDNFMGLSKYISNINDKLTLDSLLSVIIGLVDLKLPISDDLLILGLEYCNYCNKDDLMNALIKCVSDCLSNDNDNQRSYLYFKTFLLFSNVWNFRCNNWKSNSDNPNQNNTGKTIQSKFIFVLYFVPLF